jgi:hypothetical protein
MRACQLLALLQVIVLTAHAQNKIQVSGDFRVRSEYRHGFSTLADKNQNNAFFVDQRTRLLVNHSTTRYATKLSLQDVRVWGSQPQLVREDGALTAMHEAWGEFFFRKEFSVRIGRQEISLNDHRIFGNVDWVMQARSHDAALFKYIKNGFEIQSGFAYNQDRIQLSTTFYSIANNYKALQYLWLNKEYKNVTGSFLFLNNGKQGGVPDNYHTYFSQTIGTRLSYKNDRLKANLSYYYQGGKEPDQQTKIRAFDIAGDFNYQLNNHFSITPGLEFLSGNNQNSIGTTNRAFNPFYGTNHKFNGLMDYFYVGNHSNSVGLHDYYMHLNYSRKNFTCSVQTHYFEADGNVIHPESGATMSKRLGTEVDFVFQYKLSDEVRFDAGYSQFLSSNTLQALKGGSKETIQNWAWFMISLKPVFYTTPPQQQ